MMSGNITKNDLGRYMAIENTNGAEKRGHYIVGRLAEIHPNGYVIMDDEGVKHKSDHVEPAADVLFGMRDFLKKQLEENQSLKDEFKEIMLSHKTGVNDYYDSLEIIIEKNNYAYRKLITNLVDQLRSFERKMGAA